MMCPSLQTARDAKALTTPPRPSEFDFTWLVSQEDVRCLNWSPCQAAEGRYTFKLELTVITILNVTIDLQAFFHIMMVQDFITFLNKEHIVFFIIRDKYLMLFSNLITNLPHGNNGI